MRGFKNISFLNADLGCNGVLLHERLLGEVKLERVVSGDGDVEAPHQVVWEGGPVVVEEEGVVAERTHGDAHLREVVEVLDDWRLPEQQPVGDALAHHEGGDQVLHGASLATVGAEHEGVQASDNRG